MKAAVVLANGFEEIEAMASIDVLRRAGIEVDTFGLVGNVVTGSHGVRVWADKRLAELRVEHYDALILPGGPGYQELLKSSRVLELVRQFDAQHKLLAAICAAPLVLAKAGVLKGRRVTIYPGMEKELEYPRPERVVLDGHILTAQGPAVALQFALKVVEQLKGKEVAREVASRLLASF